MLGFKEWLEENKRPTTISKKDATGLLNKAGFLLQRKDGGHEIWKHPDTGKSYSLPRHNTLSPGVSREVWGLVN